jgi:hypothetical protein
MIVSQMFNVRFVCWAMSTRAKERNFVIRTWKEIAIALFDGSGEAFTAASSCGYREGIDNSAALDRSEKGMLFSNSRLKTQPSTVLNWHTYSLPSNAMTSVYAGLRTFIVIFRILQISQLATLDSAVVLTVMRAGKAQNEVGNSLFRQSG